MSRFNNIIDNLIQWDRTSDKLYAAMIVGSQAREDHHADENSDLDIIMLVDDPDYFMVSDQWIKYIGNPHVSFADGMICGGKERRVLFDGALDVDFIFLPKNSIRNMFEDSLMADLLGRGYHILIDKIKLEYFLPQNHTANQSCAMLSEQEFQNLTNDFWYHAVWAAKKLMRGEIWTAKYCVDTYMKSKLLRIIECHTHAANGPEYDTWHSGRFIEEWAEDWIIKKLCHCFSHYNKEDVKLALLSTMDLFRLLAVEVAEKLQYDYPEESDEYTTNWVTTSL
ncbi:MAG: aminoglycoside 6-adenylyltransferase [Oscillospiraceae bacterium]|jgi:aminoglycoside 6-adenylyltransferase|nr:aminoglycoside 6-adenylyltransferase [Oscillospiraceae bacterium]